MFSYHHSRPEGWSSLAQAIYGAGFSLVQAHPVKAEMSGATPKSQAKEPIQLDIIFVCQKCEQDPREPMKPSLALEQTAALALDKLNRLRGLGLTLSQNDCRVTVVSRFLALLGPIPSPQVAVHAVRSCQPRLEEIAAVAFLNTDGHASAPAFARTERQLTLFTLPE